MKLIINTDGGSRGNPGPAGIGFVVKNLSNHIIYSKGKYIGEATNNFAEYTALVYALKEAKNLKGTELEINMDSELIVKQMRGEYKIKEPTLKVLAEEARQLLQNFKIYEFNHVRREFNKEADAEVNKALDENENASKL